jgi:putative SOS response-associated peptidase YedK
MCGRFNQKLSASQWAHVFDVLRMPTTDYSHFQLRYNTAPMQAALAIRVCDHMPTLTPLQWKLIPSWSKTKTTKFNTINAKAETLETSGTYRAPFKNRRCLIPVAGFYEWPKANSNHFDEKKPFYISFRDDRPLCFAAVWDRWEQPGDIIESFSIITVQANAMMADFHDRMPVILNEPDLNIWLDHDIEDPGLLNSLLKPRDQDDLQTQQVSSQVNNWRHESPDCIVKVN